MPRSPLAARLSEIGSLVARLRENADLISRQRVAKSASPSGSVQTVWRWIRPHNHGIGCQRMVPARLTKCSAQLIEVFRQQPQPPLRQIDGEKKLPPARKLR